MYEMSENSDSIELKTTKYEHFVNEVLRNDLKNALKRQEVICQQIAQYLQIKSFIKGIEDNSLVESKDSSLKMQTDIGSNFYVECVVPNPHKVFVSIGLDIYVEYSLEEALSFIDKKELHLNEELNRLSEQTARIRANIQLVLHTIAEINSLNN